MKKAISVLLCVVMIFAASPLCTVGAADAETEPAGSALMQCESGETVQAVFAQNSMLDLILDDYASIFTYNPESMGEIIGDIKDEFLGFFMISAFGGFLYAPLLMPAVFLRLVVGSCKVIAAGIRK